ncbi:hypothetical protein PSFL_07490 [Pseudomonas sp. DD1]|uniref:hypothetical protein n=1 Tax=Pseudomonas sp. DD1 TaxID=879558 RepID=UPI0037CB1C35
MKIDLTKKPEGATHINPHSGLWVKCFGGNSGSYQYFRNGEWEMGFGCMSNSYLQIAKPEPWTGEGLPPVGTVCDLKFEHWTDWERHEILCHGKTFMFVRELNSGLDREGSMSMDGIMFRQVRTPEQIAEEKRIAELNLMVGAIKDHPGGHHGVDHLAQLKIQEEACINLYDAGWRKQVSE